jgi:hypothetical protein
MTLWSSGCDSGSSVTDSHFPVVALLSSEVSTTDEFRDRFHRHDDVPFRLLQSRARSGFHDAWSWRSARSSAPVVRRAASIRAGKVMKASGSLRTPGNRIKCLDQAIGWITAPDAIADEGAHQAQSAQERARAALRLLRPMVGELSAGSRTARCVPPPERSVRCVKQRFNWRSLSVSSQALGTPAAGSPRASTVQAVKRSTSRYSGSIGGHEPRFAKAQKRTSARSLPEWRKAPSIRH